MFFLLPEAPVVGLEQRPGSVPSPQPRSPGQELAARGGPLPGHWGWVWGLQVHSARELPPGAGGHTAGSEAWEDTGKEGAPGRRKLTCPVVCPRQAQGPAGRQGPRSWAVLATVCAAAGQLPPRVSRAINKVLSRAER